jgi:hypothetical protein
MLMKPLRTSDLSAAPLDGRGHGRTHQPRVDGGFELPFKVVQSRLGHASIQMTADTYGHLFPRGDDGSELAAAERAFLAGLCPTGPAPEPAAAGGSTAFAADHI